MKILKRIFYFLLIIFVLIQFYPKPKKNISSVASANDISSSLPVNDSVMNILKKSCYDCHSDNTHYPWYSKIQPVAMWLGHHIDEGKKELNFSQFGSYSVKRKNKKLHEIAEQVEKNEMPLSSYTLIHTDAKLTEAEKNLLINWANRSHIDSTAK